MAPVERRWPATLITSSDATHDRQVAVLVEKTTVAGEVVARIPGKVRALEGLVVRIERRQASGRQRQLDGDRAVLAARHFLASLVEDPHVVAGHGPGSPSPA